MPSDAKNSINAHHHAKQLRTETWHKLSYALDRLVRQRGAGREPAGTAESQIAGHFEVLAPIERYWDYPGRERFGRLMASFERREYEKVAQSVSQVVRTLASESYRLRPFQDGLMDDARDDDDQASSATARPAARNPKRDVEQHYFAVLFVDDISPVEEAALRRRLREMREPTDKFFYEVIVVPSFEDALIAITFNHNIQACVMRYDFPLESVTPLYAVEEYVRRAQALDEETDGLRDHGTLLGESIHELRPELDLYLVTDVAAESLATAAGKTFRRVFHREEDYLELHLSLIQGIQERYDTPFFSALKEYSRKPTGVFHAMPISRGNSIYKSHWIQDMGQFYGHNIFLAETSTTGGGLDSLLQPTGPLRKAQQLAARAFGSRRTFFVTNGTSTANKIVVQALVKPGDIVLVDRDCHKSHHYGMVLSGAKPMYLDAYAVERYSLYGAVPLDEIKQKLLSLKSEGRLHEAKMVLLTNCTFDGFVYNVRRYMEEILAIKPDMIFLWDEAWFAFARFEAISRQRTAMDAARALHERYSSPEYRQEYEQWKTEFAARAKEDDEEWLRGPLLPDPDEVQIRVYATQSTHKTLSCLRQGSMIHVFDEEFNRRGEGPFMEAYMAHTSTSPNYQILASLDVSRRQVELEGFELVRESVENAMTIRNQVRANPLLARYFDVLGPAELIPKDYRGSGIQTGYRHETDWSTVETAWREDDFVLDPTRITLEISRTGIDGYTFRNKYLMEEHGIQVNKTSLNTVLLMTNIGTTKSAVAHLLDVLCEIAKQRDQEIAAYNPAERKLFEASVARLTSDLPPLPHFSHFHTAFRSRESTTEGDMRTAFFLAYGEMNSEYIKIDGSIDEAMASGRELVSTAFVIPYPPGFPILVPGQVLSEQILTFMRKLDITEIHGYRAELGLQFFTEEALATAR